MSDSVEILLQSNQHPTAQKLLSFHRENSTFLPRIAAEFRLLKRRGRKEAKTKGVIHYIRSERNWKQIGRFRIDDALTSLAVRICILLWPDINGMARLRECGADEILGTRIVRMAQRPGTFLRPTGRTFKGRGVFLAVLTGADGKMQPIEWEGAVVLPPEVPFLDRPATFHPPIIEYEAAAVVPSLRRLVTNAPDPNNSLLLAWSNHFEAPPEIFFFVQDTMLRQQPIHLSGNNFLEYARSVVPEAATTRKQFTLSGAIGGLYGRALVLLNPKFNGYCEFRDGPEDVSNALLGCSLAPEPINGEPHRRLVCRHFTV